MSFLCLLLFVLMAMTAVILVVTMIDKSYLFVVVIADVKTSVSMQYTKL